jgi:hypothetical protein
MVAELSISDIIKRREGSGIGQTNLSAPAIFIESGATFEGSRLGWPLAVCRSRPLPDILEVQVKARQSRDREQPNHSPRLRSK